MKKIKSSLLIVGFGLLLGCGEKDVDADCKGPAQEIACYQVYIPVCGCDGYTYPNPCSAQAAGVKRTTPGECKKNG